MPELPEVTTTVNGLQKKVTGLVILDVWTDLARPNPIKQFTHTIKNKKFFDNFKKEIVGKKILKSERRAKNILVHLEKNKTILIHLKMTGHIMYGNYVYDKKSNTWTPSIDERKELHDPYNRFIHVVFSLSNKKHLAFCDARKFGKVTLLDTDTMHESIHLKNIGPEPLDYNFSVKDFKKAILSKPNKNIKTVLMDQTVIAGIGNIYSDELLWLSNVHPNSKPQNIKEKDWTVLYKNMVIVLNKGIDFGGDSTSDYRDIDGNKGNFQNTHNVYRKKGEVCGKKQCSGVIIRKVIDGRSAHFCNIHQIIF